MQLDTAQKRTGDIAVVVREGASLHNNVLLPQRSGVAQTGIGRFVGLRLLVALLFVELGDLVVNLLGLVGLFPQRVPVFVGLGSRTGADDVEDVCMCRVSQNQQLMTQTRRREVRTFSGVVALAAVLVGPGVEVFEHGLRVLAEIAEVDGLAALLQQQEAVESLEQLGRRLMDGGEDGLSVVRELAQQEHDRPRRLRVETRSRLVEEDEQGRLGDQLDTDSETLALLDVETHADFADDRLRVRFHLEELDDLLDKLELLRLRDRARLTKQCRELKGLADGGGRHVDVLLLYVAGLALERKREWLRIDEEVTSDHASVDALSENVYSTQPCQWEAVRELIDE